MIVPLNELNIFLITVFDNGDKFLVGPSKTNTLFLFNTNCKKNSFAFYYPYNSFTEFFISYSTKFKHLNKSLFYFAFVYHTLNIVVNIL